MRIINIKYKELSKNYESFYFFYENNILCGVLWLTYLNDFGFYIVINSAKINVYEFHYI